MDRASEYERRAQEAEAKAAALSDPQSKRQFLDLAKTWRELARGAGGGGAKPKLSPPPED